MSIIQTIRDKGAAIVIGVIALSLIGFLLMDANSGANKLFGNQTRTIGKVNGNDIELAEYNNKIKQAEANYPNVNGAMRQQIQQGVWDQMVAEQVVNTEFDKLGINFTPKEMLAVLYSDEAPQQLKQAFTDPQTGQYDVEKVKQWWAEVKKSKNTAQRDEVNAQVIDPMRIQTLYNKYTSMIAASIYIPSWQSAKENAENKTFANISYVAVPYTAINDSAIKVTDDDIQSYIDKNKEKYKQEAGKIISYVIFSAAPSSQDSAKVKESLLSIKSAFAADTNAKAFVARNISAMNYFDGYTLKSKMQMPNKDTLTSLSKGQVYGPYLDGGDYVLAKMIGSTTLPDSIKVRHILIGTINPQTQQPLTPDSIAKQRIDSIESAIKSGASFTDLEAKYSTDQAAHKDKGEMTFDITTVQSDNFAKEFADFVLNNGVGTKKVVKTSFGWHYIEILDKKNPQPAYKIAYMAKDITPSDETTNSANAAATSLSGSSRTLDALRNNAKKQGIQIIDIPNLVKENDYQLGGIQEARPLIKWAYEAKEGDVSEPFLVGSDYVIAAVDHDVKAGLPDVKIARKMVEAIVLNKKKADEIIKKLNNPATLEAAAAVYSKQVLNNNGDSTLTFNASLINGIGVEPKVAGAAFNKDYQAKVSAPIAGSTGVFVLKVNAWAMKPADAPEVAAQQIQGRLSQMRDESLGKSFEALKKNADIKDSRSKFF